MPTRLIYQYPRDNILPIRGANGFGSWSGVSSVSLQTGTAEASYPQDNLVVIDPAIPLKTTSRQIRVVFDMGSARSIDFFALFNHNITPSISHGAGALHWLYLEANSTNTWPGTLQQAVVVPTYMPDGFWTDPWLDLRTISPRSYRYWAFSVGILSTGGPFDNLVNVAVGTAWFGMTPVKNTPQAFLDDTIREIPVNIQWGFTEETDYPTITHQTPYGLAAVYDIGVRNRVLVGQLGTTDSGAEHLRRWYAACRGSAYPTVIVLEPDTNVTSSDAPDNNIGIAGQFTNRGPMLVRWADKLVVKRVYTNYNLATLAFEEVPHGPALSAQYFSDH